MTLSLCVFISGRKNMVARETSLVCWIPSIKNVQFPSLLKQYVKTLSTFSFFFFKLMKIVILLPWGFSPFFFARFLWSSLPQPALCNPCSILASKISFNWVVQGTLQSVVQAKVVPGCFLLATFPLQSLYVFEASLLEGQETPQAIIILC